MQQDVVYLNGQLLPADQACLPVGDAGFLHGASAFTTMYARGQKVFRLERHLARLLKTAERFTLRTDAEAETLSDAVGQLLAARSLPEARVRVTLSPGDIHCDQGTTLITAEAVGARPPSWSQGMVVAVSDYKQVPGNPETGVKTGCYFPRVLALREAARKGAQEALWYTVDNHLAEACFSNVFLVLGGKVHTPPLGEAALDGIVRQAALEICRRDDIPFDDATRLTVREMLTAEECFLTSSVAGIRPVTQIERHPVGERKPGRITSRLRKAYAELLDQECGEIDND
jgi:branched-subunit amino acid aminotransferase/4-amino-4-deoxychorismate lyase